MNELAKAREANMQSIFAQLGGDRSGPLANTLIGMAMMKDGVSQGRDLNPLLKSFERGALAQGNALASRLRNHDVRKGRIRRFPRWDEELSDVRKSEIMAKSTLDVGTLNDISQFTGGQALGMISWDTKLARGTVRPRSFTLYNYLKKTVAGNIVDYWTYASDTGGQLPGSAYASFGNQTTGTIAINAGSYSQKFINLKLAVDGRAITMALAQQNSITNVADQESTNAALNILTTVNWAAYWGNPALYPNQQKGVAYSIPSGNIFDFNEEYNSPAGRATGDSPQQFLFNKLYEVAGKISGYRNNGQVTHAFMTPAVAADMQSLVTTQLRNVANTVSRTQFESRSIVVNGDLVGMNTRFGDVAFPIDMFISARDIPAQAVVIEDDATGATKAQPTTVLAPPATVTATITTGAAATNSAFSGDYTPSDGGVYVFAAAAVDAGMNESILAYSAPVTVATGQAVNIEIAPGAVGTAGPPVAFRVYRSGLGYDRTSGQNPAAFRWVGDVVATGGNVSMVDLNATIPGSETIFLLDLDDEDDALDYRTMLPLSKIELFAQNLYMPWALAHIGAIRPRVPKWHAMIRNYPASNPSFRALSPNFDAAIV